MTVRMEMGKSAQLWVRCEQHAAGRQGQGSKNGRQSGSLFFGLACWVCESDGSEEQEGSWKGAVECRVSGVIT